MASTFRGNTQKESYIALLDDLIRNLGPIKQRDIEHLQKTLGTGRSITPELLLKHCLTKMSLNFDSQLRDPNLTDEELTTIALILNLKSRYYDSDFGTRSGTSNYATVVVICKTKDEGERLALVAPGNSLGSKTSAGETHAERAAWKKAGKDVKDKYKEKEITSIDKVVIVSDLAPCRDARNSCTDFFGPGGRATVADTINDKYDILIFRPGRDVFAYVSNEGFEPVTNELYELAKLFKERVDQQLAAEAKERAAARSRPPLIKPPAKVSALDISIQELVGQITFMEGQKLTGPVVNELKKALHDSITQDDQVINEQLIKIAKGYDVTLDDDTIDIIREEMPKIRKLKAASLAPPPPPPPGTMSVPEESVSIPTRVAKPPLTAAERLADIEESMKRINASARIGSAPTAPLTFDLPTKELGATLPPSKTASNTAKTPQATSSGIAAKKP